MKAMKFRIIVFTCAAVLLALLIAVSVVVGVFDPALTATFAGAEIDEATRQAGEALATSIEEEGIVMVKNDDNCLPLQDSDVKKGSNYQLNVFGWASIDWLSGGSGSGRAVDGLNGNSLSPATGIYEALKGYTVFSDDGIKYNTDLYDKYKAFNGGKRDAAATDTLHSHDYESCKLYEPALDSYSADLRKNADDYSKVALVVLGRIAGESNDAPKVQYKYQASTDYDRTYLDISTEEEDLLEYVGATYDKVVVIINSTNTMNLEFMDRIDGLDACLIVGGTGVNAANAIPNVLFGKKKAPVEKLDSEGKPVKDDDGNIVYEENADGSVKMEIVDVSPSGRTVDTYAYDFASNANYAYSGMDGVSQYTGTASTLYPLTTTNPNVGSNDKYPGVSYLDYQEGIYVGYKWYETADAEGFWKDAKYLGKTGYDAVVQYPFGYGLTYTTFEWNVVDWTEADGKISVTVRVHNVGDYAAQEVVELYYTPPYTKGGIEKSAVNLCAFAKTPIAVEPGETLEVDLSFNINDMASYGEKVNGNGAYILEKGDYEISLRTDSHHVADVKTGNATYTYKQDKDNPITHYTGTSVNGREVSNGTEEIHNLFTGVTNSDGVAIDGSDSNQEIEWLSRANFTGTYQAEKAAARKWDATLNAMNMYDSTDANAWDTDWALNNDTTPVKYSQNKVYSFTEGVTFSGNPSTNENYGKKGDDWKITDDAYYFGDPNNFDDDEWDTLLNQLSKDEMINLVLHGYIMEAGIQSIDKPRTLSLDGPSQIGSFNSNSPGVGYPMATVIAQTWSTKLARDFGLAVGTETLGSGRDGWYAPGTNLHRSPFGGRNYEYYSEDSFLSGAMCANTVRGALNAGVYTYIKHLIGYDQESMRDGLYCWMTEQALREVYLKPFKMAIDEGATGLMSSYGRLGAVWSGGSRSLLTDLLRNEWGFKGTVISDYSDHQDFMNGDQMLRAGGDLWMDGYGWTGKFKCSTTSAAFEYQLREASKHVIYTWANAAYEAQQYQLNPDVDPIKKVNPDVFKWWWLIVAGVDVLCAAGAGVLVFFGIRKKDKPVAEAASVESPEPETAENQPAVESQTTVENETVTDAEIIDTPSDENK